MSGDCGHGWGYHYDGPSGPCYKCEEERRVEAKYKVRSKEYRALKDLYKACLVHERVQTAYSEAGIRTAYQKARLILGKIR